MQPTLLKKGSLIRHGSKGQSDLKDYVPIDYFLQKILEMHNNKENVFLLKALTGSGKSTTSLVSCYKLFKKLKKKSIACLQPRVATTENLAEQLETEDWVKNQLGERLEIEKNIGIFTGKSKKNPRGEKPHISFYTYETFRRRMVIEKYDFFKKFEIIFVDEVHENENNIHIFLHTIKQYLIEYKPHILPILALTSATLDINSLQKYYNIPETHIFEVGGKDEQFKKYPYYISQPSKNLLDDINDTIHKIPDTKHDIIIFTSSRSENLEISKSIKSRFPSELVLSWSRTDVQEDSEDYKKIRTPQKTRRIILATNVAETGITLDTLGYLINLGWEINVNYIPYLNTKITIKEPISLSSLTQRSGRVGRKMDGVIYNLFPKKYLDILKTKKVNALNAMDISLVILNFIDDINFQDKLLLDLVYDGLYKLYYLGFIALENPEEIIKNIHFSNGKYTLTAKPNIIGSLVGKYFSPTEEEFSINDIKFIIIGYYLQLSLDDIATIIAMLNKYPKCEITCFQELLYIYENMLLEIRKNITKNKKIEEMMEWIKKNNLLEIIELKNNILNISLQMGLDIKKVGIRDDKLFHICIFYSYITNLIKNSKYRGYKVNLRHNATLCIGHSFEIPRSGGGSLNVKFTHLLAKI